MSLISKVDPKNEALRELALKDLPSRDITYLKEKTSYIHAAWLFDNKGLETLKKICLCLGGTKDSYLFPGWEDFGIRLGLDSDTIKCIRWSHLTNEGQPYETFLAYIQIEDATIDKVIEALKVIGRLDIIEKTYDLINGLADSLLPPVEVNNDESGYLSMSSAHSSNEIIEPENIRRNIIKPNSIPFPPLVLRRITNVQSQHNYFTSNVTERHLTDVPRTEEENYQNSDEPNNTKPLVTQVHSNKKKKYDCTVMLTFSVDGLAFAQEVAKEFRKEREDGKRIGVVILDEHPDKVYSNPEQFILGCFSQVKYVVPIITEGYLRSATSTSSVPRQPALECVDTKYVRRIYDLMSKDYGFEGCLNWKIRCVVPDHLDYLTQNNYLMRDPLFSVWERLSNVDKLSQRMLSSKI